MLNLYQMDDVIFIPSRGKTVSIRGKVNRDGIYELKENEGLNDLIQLSGGLSVSAYTRRIQINRIVPEDKRDMLEMDRMLVDVDPHSILLRSLPRLLH